MPPTRPPQRGSDPATSTTPIPRVDATLHLPTRTLNWLTEHPQARQFVRSVWDKLTELERSGQYPGVIDALRRVLTYHQPTSAGRCRTCARVRGAAAGFPASSGTRSTVTCLVCPPVPAATANRPNKAALRDRV
jgi:hypothetical protein